jgi:peptidoglycan/LPS O-acetylase OafA/YrhL
MEVLGRFPFKVFLMRYGVFFALGMAIWCYSRDDVAKVSFLFFLGLVAFCLLEILYDRPGLREGGGAVLIWLISLNVLVISALRPNWISVKLEKYNAWSRKLGLLSYPLYLNHYTLGMCVVAFFARAALGLLETFALSVSVVFLVSYVIMTWPERAIQRRLLAMI